MEFKQLLEEWGFLEYVQIFQDEGIDDESFLLLDEETIRKIFTKSGHRLLFQKQFKTYCKEKIREGKENAKEDSIEVETISNASTETVPSTSDSDTELEFNNSYSFEPDDEFFEVLQSRTLKEVQNIPLFLKPQSPKRESDLLLEQPPQKTRFVDSLFTGGLETILKKYTDGQIALAAKYKLSNCNRQKIVKVIINELIAAFGIEIRASSFLRVSEEIENLFPNEKSETYYIPYVPGKKNRKGYGPKGKLWSRYVNVRTALRCADNTKKNLTLKPSQEKSPEKTSDECLHLSFLKAATEPYLKILDAWEQTYRIRKRHYINANLETIYNDFPCLKLNFGIELLETDFNKKFFDQKDIIYTTWPKISAAILKEVAERNIDIGTQQFKDSSLHALMTLPYLFSPVSIKKTRKGEIWRPTRSEVQESFFLHVLNYEDLEERLSSRKKKLSECRISLQPTGCVVGNLSDPDGFYIVVDHNTYKVDSSIRALELLFKLFHALDLEYPAEGEAIWLFIQEMVFHIKSIKKSPSSGAVCSDIKYHLQAS